jgi:hypothetical protein
MTTARIPTLHALMALWLVLPVGLSASNRPHRAKAVAQATLRVSNTNRQAVFVVLIAERPDGWAQWPLGTIEGNAARTFRLNRSVLDVPNVRIVASAFSNWKEYESNPLTMTRGSHLDLTLNNPEPRSLLASR